jgi:intermediate cleaving peptidase 55
LSSNTSGPVYIDLPSHSVSTFSRTRARSPSRTFLQYLSSAGSGKQVDESDEIMAALQKREVKSAATKVERLRLIKSEAEVKAMRKAADISADAHSKVSKGLFWLEATSPAELARSASC